MRVTAQKRSRRMDLRTTPEERDLIDRAVAAMGTDLTEFVVSDASEARAGSRRTATGLRR